jgi:hypothetical protein
MKKVLGLFVGLLFILLTHSSYSQVTNQTSFENYADEFTYLQSSWVSDGFTVPWVNGFNQARCHVDNAFSHTGTKSLRVDYPANNFGTANSGAQAPLKVTPKDQYYISYWVNFSANFDYGGTNEGGKLPGLAGGANCSGCAVCTGANGFSARLMWRPGGMIVLYLYHLDKVNPPCGDNITLKNAAGADMYFQKAVWYNVVERVKVNSGTNHDGEVEIWINGVHALLKTGFHFVSNGDKVDNLYFSTFHGGSDATWAPSVNCNIWFDDIVITENVGDVNTGAIDAQVPTTPTNLTASATTATTTNLTWTASTDNEGVTGYDIYQNGVFLKNVTATTASITGLTALNTYTFTVKAKDAAGNSSVASNICSVTTSAIIVTQTISLIQGWNLISINVNPNDSTISTLFNGLDVQEIKSENAFWEKGQSSYLNSLLKIEPSKGYLVNMNTTGNLTVSGIQTLAMLPTYTNGWNIIGCPYQTSSLFSTYFNASNCLSIKNFEGFWIPNGTSNSISAFVPGKGYFLKK